MSDIANTADAPEHAAPPPAVPVTLPPAAAPAPSVEAQVQTLAPAETASAPVTLPPATEVPVAPPADAAPAATPAVAVEIRAESMAEAADPAAGIAPPPPAGEHAAPPAGSEHQDAHAVPPPAVPPPSPHAPAPHWQPAFARPRRSPARLVIAGIAAILFIGIASVVGVSVANGLERSRIENEVRMLVENANAAFSAGDIAGASQFSRQAGVLLDTSPQQLDPTQVQQWRGRIEHFATMKAEADQLDAVFRDADKDLAHVRDRLKNKQTLYGPATAENQPLVAKLENHLRELGDKELKRKHDALRTALEDANALYLQGKIEAAGVRAADITKQMNDAPAVQDHELQKRLTILSKRAEQLKAMKDLRLAARSGTYADAKKKMQAQLDALDENNADLKPLHKRIADLRNELVLEEKRSHKLTDQETKRLQQVARFIAGRDAQITTGAINGDTIGLQYAGADLRFGSQKGALGDQWFVEARGYRLVIEGRDLERRPGRVLTHALALSEAMQQAGVSAEEIWNAADEAPLMSARRITEDGKEMVFLGGRLYTGKPVVKTVTEKEAEADYAKKAESLAVAVENDAGAREEVRRVVAVAVRAAYKDAEWFDHLPGDFVRKVVDGGYIEANMPGAAERLKAALTAYRDAYTQISRPRVNFSGQDAQGNEAVEMRTFEEHAIWRLYDKGANTTSFAIKNPDDERGCLFVLYDFPGKLTEFPAQQEPKTVRMTHQSVGVTATCDLTTGKLTADQAAWNRAVVLEGPTIPPNVRTSRGFGPPEWCLPPHVLLLDMQANTKGIVTPYGRLNVEDFSTISDPAKRKAVMDAYLDRMAKVLPSGNYLHLFFRYFTEYTLDSPVTSSPNLLGSRAHCGDMHQTAYESLERLMGGRYAGDCDDLAEFFMNVTRRQQKLSYVMALPQHAACGWAEKLPPAAEYTFYVLDTGPPRMFKHADLEQAIEMAFRAYDETKTMRFDPKSLGFLFRFNNEPTRSPYYLSSRMYVDPVYADAMERVQGHWHFHFYALGIETMTKMIEGGDRVPENCIELAGLYGQVREIESSIRWTNEALKQFTPEQRASRLDEQFRIAFMWRGERENENAYEALKDLIAELKRLEQDPKSQNYLSMRMQTMGLLTSLDRPWEAWDLVAKDMNAIAAAGRLRIEHAGSLTTIYDKMKRQIREGKAPTADEKDKLNKLERMLAWFYDQALFEAEDDFNDYMRKYAFVGLWYAGKYGRDRFMAELLKDGPFPDPAKPRQHANRKNPEEEDWKWIRLSLASYGMEIGDAIDLDDPPEKWRRDDAVKLAEAMFRAAEHARKFGSLSSAEFQLLSMRVFRAFLVKDWADLEKVLKLTKEKDWARLTSDIAETFGRGARFVTPEEFVAQYRVFTRYITARTAYFTVIYEALRAEGFEHALQASKVALECCPDDQDMKREVKYLEELVRKRLAAKAAQPKKAEAKAEPKKQSAPPPAPVTPTPAPTPK